MSDLLPEENEVIEVEIQILDEVIQSLKKQCRRSSDRLVVESRRARELTAGLVAARRDEDKQMLASDEAVSHALKDQFGVNIKTLSRLIEKPYFARIELLEDEANGRPRKVEYKIGFAANSDCRIIDWRKAPISRLYYEYKEGEEYSEIIQGKDRQGKVLVRNQLDIEKSRLRRITCRHGQFLHTDGKWQKLEHTGKSLREHYGKLPSILSLITKEQFQTITEDADTAVLIQGIAGSGKTTVALHRLSWLLHEDNSDLREQDCVVIVLSKSLKAYIQNSLPALQIYDVPVLTLHEWSFGMVKTFGIASGIGVFERPEDRSPAGIGRVKRSLALLRALTVHATKQCDDILKTLALKLPWESLPSGVRTIFDRGVDRKIPAGRLMVDIEEGVAIAREKIDSANPRSIGLSHAVELLREQRKRLFDIPNDILSILDKPRILQEFDDSKLLDEPLIREAYLRTKSNFERNRVDPADDALIIRLFELKFGGLPAAAGQVATYGHLIVDEVQDLSAIDIENILGGVNEVRRLTLVGDVQQKLDESAPFPGWEKLTNDMLLKDSFPRFVTLEVSHRSTLPIMRLAEHVQQQKIVKEGRAGRTPIYFKCRGESHGIRAAINWLRKAVEKYPTAITAVVCADEEIARQTYKFLKPTFGPLLRLGIEESFSFEEGIVVTEIREVKGLEFCNVLLWNPSKRSFPDTQTARNMLYVAITRAEENLCIVAWQTPAEMLPSLSSRLVRGVDLTVDGSDESS